MRLGECVLTADLQVGEETAVFVAEGAVEADFWFAAGLEDGVSLLIGNANAELLDDHAPGVGKAEDLVGKAESHGGSISSAGEVRFRELSRISHDQNEMHAIPSVERRTQMTPASSRCYTIRIKPARPGWALYPR
jgi:hypothetical protein